MKSIGAVVLVVLLLDELDVLVLDDVEPLVEELVLLDVVIVSMPVVTVVLVDGVVVVEALVLLDVDVVELDVVALVDVLVDVVVVDGQHIPSFPTSVVTVPPTKCPRRLLPWPSRSSPRMVHASSV